MAAHSIALYTIVSAHNHACNTLRCASLASKTLPSQHMQQHTTLQSAHPITTTSSRDAESRVGLRFVNWHAGLTMWKPQSTTTSRRGHLIWNFASSSKETRSYQAAICSSKDGRAGISTRATDNELSRQSEYPVGSWHRSCILVDSRTSKAKSMSRLTQDSPGKSTPDFNGGSTL